MEVGMKNVRFSTENWHIKEKVRAGANFTINQ